MQMKLPVIQLTTHDGTKVTDSASIVNAFKLFYHKVYNLSGFIRHALPSVTDSWGHGEPNHSGGVDALSSTKFGEAPGPDGLSLNYFKTIQDRLSPYFLRIYICIITDHPPPLVMLRAHIMFLKPNKYQCCNYRPNTLLNVHSSNKTLFKNHCEQVAPPHPSA